MNIVSRNGQTMKGRKSENIRKLKEEKRESKGNSSHSYHGRFVFASTSTKRLLRLICVEKNNTFVWTRMKRHRSNNEECR